VLCLLAATLLRVAGASAAEKFNVDPNQAIPKPDAKPADMKKPVKVFILMGQSNMVGMGDISGGGGAWAGFILKPVLSVYEGNYSSTADYDNRKPVSTTELKNIGEMKSPTSPGEFTAVVRGQIQKARTYQFTSGYAGSSYNIVAIADTEVYRRDVGKNPVIRPFTIEEGKTYPIKITYLTREISGAGWYTRDDSPGTLNTLVKQQKKYPFLIDDGGQWTVRKDVYYYDARTKKGSPLSPTSNNGGSIGPELGFGYVMGQLLDEPVLILKSCNGNRGLGWFQGHKDSGAPKEEYEKHLVNLINDLRKEFKAPKMPAVVATVGFHGYELLNGPWKGVWEAQMAVGDTKQHPELAGTVASIDTRDFWREVEESPRGQDYHYNRNPETYLLVGEAMGRAMVRMLGGAAVAIPKSDREARTAARLAAEAAKAAKPAPTAKQKAASLAAIKPMILDGALAAYVSNPRYLPSLQAALKGEKPVKVSPNLEDALDEEADYYRAAGIADYDWKPFGGDLKVASWDYFSFDLPDPQVRKKGISDLKVTCLAGMENWFAPDFDAKKAGWKSGAAPFGVEKDPIKYPEWYGPSKRVPPQTVCEKDVLLLRLSFDLPPLKDGHRYRIRVGGSIHANSGEGYAIYVNGKLLAESKGGVVAWRREGGKPRGGHVWADFRDEFKGGNVTIAVSNFPMNNGADDRFIPARAPLSVWLEEMKIPPLAPNDKAAQ
jgi:hypothetical protein